MALVRYGNVSIFQNPLLTPWWFSLIVTISERVKNIREAGAQDVEKQAAPKDFWLDDKELELWFEEREKIRRRKMREPEPLEDEY